jgi:molybdopterin-containing oxidoreductase family iron-sulfur binding subunit
MGGRDMARAGARLAFGQDVDTQYALANAAVIVGLDADFLGCGPAHLPLVRAWAGRRRPGDGFSRLYTVESTLTPTGAKADHRLALRAADVEAFARALAARVGVAGVAAPADAAPEAFLAAAARDLAQQRGRGVVIPGDQQPPVVHALAHAMNEALANVGRTVVRTGPVEARPEDQTASLRALVADMEAGKVELLVILGGNPAYTAPADIPFASALERVALRVRLGLYHDETSERCHWHVPEAHFMEAWSDVRAFDGTVSIVQPLIAPLYGGRSAHEVLAAFGERPEASPYDLVRERWGRERRGAEFENDWRRWLHDGVVPFTAARATAVRARGTFPPPAARPAGVEIVFRPDPVLHDGRFANNGWLQELPRPLTHVTWDNPVLIGAATAERLGLATEDVVELRRDGRRVTAPVWIQPGHPEDSVTVYLGHGRRRAGRVGTDVGFDAGALRITDAGAFGLGVEIVGTGRRQAIPTTQPHHRMEGRDIVRVATLADLVASHRDHDEHEASLYPPWEHDGHRWAMAIDLSTCVGCNACVVACQAENNIPVVGRDQVLRGREMHWLRIDTYHTGDPVAPETYFMPVPCMHCENAPCELVCPTEATVHSAEGLNDMVYNRCVGTRYCSNNCPYKVRRFNYLAYADWTTESLKAMRNPDVSVRSRGVMEKCTYCVQRLTHGRITAEKEGRRLRDGEVVTACAQACPAEAIVFGDLNDPASRVVKLRAEQRHYALLAELNTNPRTTYLAALRNPDPELG